MMKGKKQEREKLVADFKRMIVKPTYFWFCGGYRFG